MSSRHKTILVFAKAQNYRACEEFEFEQGPILLVCMLGSKNSYRVTSYSQRMGAAWKEVHMRF